MTQTSTALLHTCAAEECMQRISRRQLLMCLTHWRIVPKALQREVYSTIRRAQRTNVDADWSAYADAVARAIAAVREKEIKRQLRRDSHGDVLNLEAES